MFHRVEEILVPPTARIVLEGQLNLVPSELVRVFGSPTSEHFDRESLGAYYFRGADERPFMLYFCAHDLGWWAMRKLRSSFWTGLDAQDFSIGTLRGGDVSDFKAWIAEQLAAR